MKQIIILFIILFLSSCSKPKTVLICGDHLCVNKAEAEQYFEENLTIEVKIIKNQKKKEIDLIEVNLNEDFQTKREITLLSKKNTNKELKKLSNKEVSKIKQDIKLRKNKLKTAEKIIKKEHKTKKGNVLNKNKLKLKNNEIYKTNVNKKIYESVDVCTILDKCSIDEISRYLLKQGKKKNFPDITIRQ